MKIHGLYAPALLIAIALPLSAQHSPPTSGDWKAVDAALGRSGNMQPGEVYKFAMPRKDLKVTKDGVTIAPGLALGSWAAFKSMGSQTMLMGDLVLTEDEVESVMLKLQQNGIQQTALHNHLLGENPHILYMHIAGQGDAVKLASTLSSALALTKTPGGASLPGSGTVPTATEKPTDLNVQGIEKALGFSGKVNGGILQITVPRNEKIMEEGLEIPPSMGTATAINFQPTGGGKAAISGDFVLLAKEVNPVLKALRTYGIEVEAVHNHMLDDEPHLYFMHFWANDDGVKEARGLRAALDETNSVKSTNK